VSLPPNLLKGTDECARRFDTFIKSFPLPTEPESGTFYHVTTGLSRAAIRNYWPLRRAHDDDAQDYLAWACRNLLELNVFMKCVLMSRDKALEFGGYRWIDGIQILECLDGLEQLLSPGTTHSFATQLLEFRDKAAAEGCTQKRHLNAGEWAREIGMGEEFATMNKVCSKLVHPTVWSILTEDIGSARFTDAEDLFYVNGAKYFTEIYVLLKEHVEKYGINHKPSEPQ
jgi:hypothetical protein